MEKLSCADKEWGNVPVAFGRIIHASLIWPEKWKNMLSWMEIRSSQRRWSVGWIFLGQSGLAAFVWEQPKRLSNG